MHCFIGSPCALLGPQLAVQRQQQKLDAHEEEKIDQEQLEENREQNEVEHHFGEEEADLLMMLDEEEDFNLASLPTKEETKEFQERIWIKYSEKSEGNSNYYNLIIQKSWLLGPLLT